LRTRGLWIVVLGWVSLAGAGDPARVREAAERLYIHGMTAAIADTEVGRDGVPQLLGLLDDPAFSRHDNVVAFLAYLGGAESTRALLESLNRPLPADATPDEIRARILVPHALGRIAGRGEPAALAALMAATADRARGGPIGEAARRGGYPSSVRAALAGESTAALAFAGGAQARRRLKAIADRRVVPDPAGVDLSAEARGAMALMDELQAGGGATAGARGPLAAPAPSQSQAAAPAPSAPTVFYNPDPATRSRGHALGFANHVNLFTPMTATRLDDVLAEASLRAGVAEFDGDVPCCTAVARSGSARTFGATTDTLATIDTEDELTTVLNVTVARAKVVFAINYCGGPGTNIIGCSYFGGKGMVLARLSSLNYESVLWIHEYGHNIGLDHTGDTRFIMYYSDSGSNCGMSSLDCAKFHTPMANAAAVTSDIGTCTDDGDALADPVDNCPLVANDAQLDMNDNGIGDACEACSGAGDPDHDGVCPQVDNCPAVANPNQANFDDDPYGDACETGALRADANLSGRVDGVDLARFGRAFGASTGGARYDADVDFDRDGTVDGADLALIAAVFGDRSF
jgi:hypothetical protein